MVVVRWTGVDEKVIISWTERDKVGRVEVRAAVARGDRGDERAMKGGPVGGRDEAGEGKGDGREEGEQQSGDLLSGKYIYPNTTPLSFFQYEFAPQPSFHSRFLLALGH